ncbi:hypothetical protein SAMN02745945_02302 [Peptoclostridium litorale DSM 5388]|uniref:Uncharacterized protein n=1 Tax=Peptoclostridium litorale DSM 5388 TaxID=1121324 RepID=A0A069RBH6_PEPLI|nr:hypothetical protein CLIT_20c00740 [Peptoclostridium litorale DSM 5388]SIO24049.1 hypothetical protein SAMN02745945_02302 [Peptoclostridium litorale DSM 5388]
MRSSSLIIMLGIFWCVLEGKFSSETLILGALISICVYCLNKLNYTSK